MFTTNLQPIFVWLLNFDTTNVEATFVFFLLLNFKTKHLIIFFFFK